MVVHDLNILELVISPGQKLPVMVTCRGEGDYYLPQKIEKVSDFFRPIPITFDNLMKLARFEKVTETSLRLNTVQGPIWVYKTCTEYNLWLPSIRKKIRKLEYFHELQNSLRDNMFSNDVNWLRRDKQRIPLFWL